MERPKVSKWGLISGILAILASLMLFFSGYGYQWGWWGLGTAFQYLIPGSALLAFIGLALAVVFAFVNKPDRPRRLKWMAYLGTFLGIAVLANVGYWYYEAQQYPPIHDITTDTQNPPTFDASITKLRADWPNPSKYGGPDIAKVQLKYYPDIKTLYLDDSYSNAFNKALAAAKKMPWEKIETADKSRGIIEATDKLAWFGFKDDIVIRVDTAETTNRSKIDVRSVSRIGRGDLGVNADRVRDYLATVKKQ
ncbi:MAG TPA: DUF1499 domain-containing protein [Balneolaceae bacterium]|nr:DUF1499 domain-containing protein [Balneolaceae bacterium]